MALAGLGPTQGPVLVHAHPVGNPISKESKGRTEAGIEFSIIRTK